MHICYTICAADMEVGDKMCKNESNVQTFRLAVISFTKQHRNGGWILYLGYVHQRIYLQKQKNADILSSPHKTTHNNKELIRTTCKQEKKKATCYGAFSARLGHPTGKAQSEYRVSRSAWGTVTETE